MFNTIEEIYTFIGQSILDNLSIEWQEAVLNIEIDTGYVSYGGGVTNEDNEYVSFSVRKFPREIRKAIKKLHKITTEGGHNRWNKAKFTMDANHKFEMEFIWDQEKQDEVDKLNEELA